MQYHPEKSKLLYEVAAKFVKLNACYDNTYRLLMQAQQMYPNIEILFCYIQLIEGAPLYTRHACYIDGEDIVDPTLANKKNFPREYIRLKQFSPGDYVSALALDKDHRTSLDNYLCELDKRKEAELLEQNKLLIK